MEKTVLITGASRGLGKALAFVFARQRYNLILHSRRIELPEMAGVQIDYVYGDLKGEGTITRLREIGEERGVDILINNAGVHANKSLCDMWPTEIEEMLSVNLIAPILLTRAIWPVFKAKRSGLIVNINSLAGKCGSVGESIYCASKYGLRGFSDALQFEATRENIRVINVCLGAMKTDMTQHREDVDKLIQVEDAANLIFSACNEYESLRVTEVDVLRRNY